MYTYLHYCSYLEEVGRTLLHSFQGLGTQYLMPAIDKTKNQEF